MGRAQQPGPAGQSGDNADIDDGTLARQADQPAGTNSTFGGGLAPPYIPSRSPIRPREQQPELPSPEAVAYRDRVLAYLRQFSVPTQVQLGHLWNAVPVISLGENHGETAAIAKVISRVVMGYGRKGDLIGFEGDPKEQAAVDSFIQSGNAVLSERAKLLRPVLLACRERKVDMVFMGTSSSGRTSDEGMLEVLNKRTGGRLAGRRMLLWTGKAHALMNRPLPDPAAFVYLVVDKLGRENVTIVNMHSRNGTMDLGMPPGGDRVTISLSNLSPVLVPTAGPFVTGRFYLYTAVATKCADYIGIV